MSTSSMQRWLLASAVTLGVHLLVVGVGVAVAQEQDHLEGYKIKDLNKVPAPFSANLVNQFGAGSCTLKKPQYFLVSSAKNGGNDPRGASVADFVCYKATCTGPLPPTTAANSQFGTHSLAKAKAKLLCLPVQVCGDNVREGAEACDGTDAANCPGLCHADCTCPPTMCGNNVQEGTEQCDGTDAAVCPGQCQADCTCTCASIPTCAGGQLVGGFCWYLGGEGATCDATCAAHAKYCDPGTITYAGTAGTDAHCQAVLQALGISLSFGANNHCNVLDNGTGCSGQLLVQHIGAFETRCTNAPTVCGAADSTASRACACK